MRVKTERNMNGLDQWISYKKKWPGASIGRRGLFFNMLR